MGTTLYEGWGKVYNTTGPWPSWGFHSLLQMLKPMANQTHGMAIKHMGAEIQGGLGRKPTPAELSEPFEADFWFLPPRASEGLPLDMTVTAPERTGWPS